MGAFTATRFYDRTTWLMVAIWLMVAFSARSISRGIVIGIVLTRTEPISPRRKNSFEQRVFVNAKREFDVKRNVIESCIP